MARRTPTARDGNTVADNRIIGSVISFFAFGSLDSAVDHNAVLVVVADKPQTQETLKTTQWNARPHAPSLKVPTKHQELTYRGVSSSTAATIRRTMIPDRDIYRIAIAMLERHGASASTYAELEAEKLLDEGDEGRFRTWLRIRLAMERLQEVPPSPTLH